MKNVNGMLRICQASKLLGVRTFNYDDYEKILTLMLPEKSTTCNLGDKIDTFPRHYSNWQHNVCV